MTCDQIRPLLHAYLDDELDLATALQIETHLRECPSCQKGLEAARAISRAAVQQSVYLPAPAALRDQISRTIRANMESTEASPFAKSIHTWWKRPLAFSGLAAAILLVVGSILMVLPSASSQGQIDELVGSHVRSLEASHLMDVESTDQHTVKPWFAGKLDFSPPVIDLAGDGFPLIGGRLDYLDHQKVAALIYRRNKHVINLFVWPGDTSAETGSRQGFNLIRFSCKGMTCWAVSDLNTAELQQFTELFKSR